LEVPWTDKPGTRLFGRILDECAHVATAAVELNVGPEVRFVKVRQLGNLWSGHLERRRWITRQLDVLAAFDDHEADPWSKRVFRRWPKWREQPWQVRPIELDVRVEGGLEVEGVRDGKRSDHLSRIDPCDIAGTENRKIGTCNLGG
jgi:hypothetical protein